MNTVMTFALETGVRNDGSVCNAFKRLALAHPSAPRFVRVAETCKSPSRYVLYLAGKVESRGTYAPFVIESPRAA